MVFVQNVFPALGLVGAFVSLAVVVPAARNREKPGAIGLLLAGPGASLFSLSLVLWWLSLPGLVGYIANNAGVLGALLLTFGWLLTIVEHTETVPLTRRVFMTVGCYIAVVQTLVLTNPYHRLFIYPGFTLRAEPLFELPVRLNLVHIFVMYVVGLGGCLLLVSDILGSSGTRRMQSGTLLLSIFPPLFLNVLAAVRVTATNLTPLGLVVTTLGIGWAVFRTDFLDIVPVGRTRAVENMRDPVVTIDTEERVIDANAAARELAGVNSEWEGMAASAFFEPFPELVSRLQSGDETGETVTVTHQGRQRDFSLTVSPISRQQGQELGRVVVFREVTLLKEREQQLDLLRRVQSRVLRHNIRNELDVITAQNEVLAAELGGDHAEMAETTLSSADRLLSVSSKARTAEELVEHDQTPTTVDLTETARSVVDSCRETFPGVSFSVDTPSACRVETLPAIELALQNLVENAAEHNTTPSPEVAVTVATADEEVVVTVSDNGPGIPEQELAVREKGAETPLEHGRGVGLWVVDWVVESSGATLSFDTGEAGTTATLALGRSRSKGR
ncbi:sensor histidine kinase [Halovenus salina]|uniref:histidine kinase n=1 Tax=Halovenus salina TaxID=1510225 RepID=A0ABD5VXM9_9EURY|nr:histidine kinase N-terminal 7TM domain-containing protein [Halovenus salina]